MDDYDRRRIAVIRQAKALKPLIDALSSGKLLEFQHNDDEWRVYRGVNLDEVVMSPHRYRIKSQ